MTHTDAAPGHDIGIITATPRVTHDAHASHIEITVIDPAVIHHTDLNCRSSTHRSSSAYHSRDHSRSHSHPSYKSTRWDLHRSHLTFQQIMRQTTPQEEPESENRRSTHRLLQFWWPFWQLRRGSRSFKLNEPSPSSDSHEQGGLATQEQVTVALIMDCPKITIYTGESYKCLIDSGAAIWLIRYSTY